MLLGSSEDWAEPPGAAGDQPQRAQARGIWRLLKLDDVCLSTVQGEATCRLQLWVRGGTFQNHGCHGGPNVLPAD